MGLGRCSLKRLNQKFNLTERFALDSHTFVKGRKICPQFIRQSHIDAVVYGQAGRKGKMGGILKEFLRRCDNFHAYIKKSRQHSFDGFHGYPGLESQDVKDFIKREVGNDDFGFAFKQVFFKANSVFGIGFFYASRILRIVSMELKSLSTLPNFLRNSSISFDAFNMARRSLSLCLMNSSIFIPLAICFIYISFLMKAYHGMNIVVKVYQLQGGVS